MNETERKATTELMQELRNEAKRVWLNEAFPAWWEVEACNAVLCEKLVQYENGLREAVDGRGLPSYSEEDIQKLVGKRRAEMNRKVGIAMAKVKNLMIAVAALRERLGLGKVDVA